MIPEQETYQQQLVRMRDDALARAVRAECDVRAAEDELGKRRRQVAQLTEQRDTAQAALALLHQGEEPYDDDRLAPTPAQWIWRWNRATPAERLERAEQVIADYTRLNVCMFEHTGQRQRAEQAEARIAATGARIAHRIRAELVCCHLYARVNDSCELTFEEALVSRDWHDLCYWGEAAARLAESAHEMQTDPVPGHDGQDARSMLLNLLASWGMRAGSGSRAVVDEALRRHAVEVRCAAQAGAVQGPVVTVMPGVARTSHGMVAPAPPPSQANPALIDYIEQPARRRWPAWLTQRALDPGLPSAVSGLASAALPSGPGAQRDCPACSIRGDIPYPHECPGHPGGRLSEDDVAAILHARCAHPGWEYATTTGQRKAWDDADVPPEGEGWESNRAAGRDGWERFEYHEESYWRRLRVRP